MIAGAAVHLIQRGNNRAQCSLHAYCLMTNHVHLLVTAHELRSCATLMKHLGQLYAQYVNKTYGRTGNLWEGRFKSCLVQSERYLLMCYRYVEVNPVRAGMAQEPGEYPWSSFRANAYGEVCDFLTPHDEYLCMGATTAERCAAYRETFGARDTSTQFEELRRATNAGYVVGDDGFKTAMARMLGCRVAHGVPGRPATKADGETADLFAG